jgi:glycosyltransferase involved in cell wall biosynthesis
LRIVHVVHSYWPAVGGIEGVVKALAEGMASRGHEVHVVTSAYSGRPAEEVVNGVRVHRVRSLRLGFPDLTYPLRVPRELLRSADVVHGHSQNGLFTVKVLGEAKGLGARTAIHFMAVDSLRDHPNPLVRLLGPLYGYRNVRAALRAADLRLVKSYRDMEVLRTRYGAETVYVPDGVDEKLLAMPNMAERFREMFKVNDPFVVYVGRLHRLKGVDVLIGAMAAVRGEAPELKAVIVGPGDRRPYLALAERLGVRDRVIFTGYVDEEAKVGAIDASLALVLPSVSDYAEAFSLAITEAWARGKPVIASAVGEVPYRVKNMVNGLLVPPRDPRALAEAIIAIYSDSGLAYKLGLKGRDGVYTWNQVIDKLLSLYATGKA